jgi:hypothetical protein
MEVNPEVPKAHHRSVNPEWFFRILYFGIYYVILSGRHDVHGMKNVYLFSFKDLLVAISHYEAIVRVVRIDEETKNSYASQVVGHPMRTEILSHMQSSSQTFRLFVILNQ